MACAQAVGDELGRHQQAENGATPNGHNGNGQHNGNGNGGAGRSRATASQIRAIHAITTRQSHR